MIDYKKKKCPIERLIQWLEDVETRKYRGCHLCTHIGEPSIAHSTPRNYDAMILSPCLACNRRHDCFELDHEKLAEEVESGHMTKGDAKHLCEKEEQRRKEYYNPYS